LLEKILSAFTQKDSHGIIQGVYPSDFLGNYYLIAIDDFLRSNKLDFLRFVDDYWIFFPDVESAKTGLIKIGQNIRREGLSLNESKIKIEPIKDFVIEETELDRLFKEIRDSFIEVIKVPDESGYGFEPFDVEIIPKDAEFKTIVKVYQKRNETSDMIERIDKFCIPYLAKYNSDLAIVNSLNGIIKKPHLMRTYSQYLGSLAKHGNIQVYLEIEKMLLGNKLIYSWQKMWLYNILLQSEKVTPNIVDNANSILFNKQEHETVRAICALIVSKYGDGAKRRGLRNHYSNELSEYVKDAILYATKYFPSADDRNVCINSWRKHSAIRELIAIAIINQIHSS
jgi:hypothetical protein